MRIGIVLLLLSMAILAATLIVEQIKATSQEFMSTRVVVDPYYHQAGLHQRMPRLAYSEFVKNHLRLTDNKNSPVVNLVNHDNSVFSFSIIYTVNQEKVKDIDVI